VEQQRRRERRYVGDTDPATPTGGLYDGTTNRGAMLDEADRRDLENLRLRLRVLSGRHKLAAIENAEAWEDARVTEAEGKSVAYGTAADHVAVLLDGEYERRGVDELIAELPEQWNLNLLRYAAHTEREE
jgi:hypothetical protein